MYKPHLSGMPESGSSYSSNYSDDSHVSELNELLQQVDKLTSEKPEEAGNQEKNNVTVDGNLSFTETQYKGDNTITKEF